MCVLNDARSQDNHRVASRLGSDGRQLRRRGGALSGLAIIVARKRAGFVLADDFTSWSRGQKSNWSNPIRVEIRARVARLRAGRRSDTWRKLADHMTGQPRRTRLARACRKSNQGHPPISRCISSRAHLIEKNLRRAGHRHRGSFAIAGASVGEYAHSGAGPRIATTR
jgi:hypothetical protein